MLLKPWKMKSDPQVLSFNIAQHVHNIYVWSLQASFGLLNTVRTTYLHSFAKVIIPYLLTKLEDRQNSRPVILEKVKIVSLKMLICMYSFLLIMNLDCLHSIISISKNLKSSRWMSESTWLPQSRKKASNKKKQQL